MTARITPRDLARIVKEAVAAGKPVKVGRAECKACKGSGYVLWRYPAKKPKPAHWFTTGAIPCDECEEK